MEGLGSFALLIVGLAAFITLAQSGPKPRNVDEVYALFVERLNFVELRLEDTERSLNTERLRSRSLEAKVRRLEGEIRRYKGSDNPVVPGEGCGVSKAQFDGLWSGMIAEKHRASQADKAISTIKSRLQNISTRLGDIELDSQLLKDRANETAEMVDIITRRSHDLSARLEVTSLKAGQAMTNTYETTQTVDEMKTVIENQSARLDVTGHLFTRLTERTNRTDKTFRNLTALLQDLQSRVDDIEQGDGVLMNAMDVEGPPSLPIDDTSSIATCPDNTTVVGCRCSHEDRSCDGVEVRGQKCLAWKSGHGNHPIQAHAKCVHGGSFVIIRDPEIKSIRSSQPHARCPSHTRVAACWLHNWWMHFRYVKTILDRDDNGCTVSGPCTNSVGGASCRIQALCQEN